MLIGLPNHLPRNWWCQVSEFKPLEIIVDGRTIELTEDNHGLAMFRDMPEADYIDITEPVGPDDEEMHTLLFRQRIVMLWMGRIALLEDDSQLLEAMEETNGTFRERTGYNSHVYIEDKPSEFELDMYIKSSLTDLSDTLPSGWGNED